LTYPPTMPLGTPPPPPPSRTISTGAVVAIVIGVVVVLVCGICMVGGIVNAAISKRTSIPNAQATTSARPTPATVAAAPSSIPRVTTASTDAPRTSAPPATKILVPNGVGADYQTAQDLWRGAGLHVAPAIDATGANRLPVIDSNWVVLAQDPPANTEVDAGTFITATVKKYTDS
jgi:hypothetical protein